MEFQAIRRSSAPEMVVEQILKQIKEGELLPGKMLPSQRKLSELLGVGRSSVREAVNALAVMGYLDVVQGRGTFIRDDIPSIDPSIDKLALALEAGSLFQLMEARSLLECKSAELAARRRGPGHLELLEGSLERMRSAGDDYDLFLHGDMAFHKCLAGATGNAVICEMTRLVLEKTVNHHGRLNTEKLSSDYLLNSVRTAELVASAVKEGKGRDAFKYMHEHLGAIGPELREVIIP